MTVGTSRGKRKGDIDLIVNCKRSLVLVAAMSNISVPGFYDGCDGICRRGGVAWTSYCLHIAGVALSLSGG